MAKQFVLTLGLLTVIVVSAPLTARAQSKPIQLSLLTPVQIFPEQTPIAGLRLNVLYGRNVSVQGLDVGLVNHTTTGHFKGVQFGIVGMADSDFDGAALVRAAHELADEPGRLRAMSEAATRLAGGSRPAEVIARALLQRSGVTS